MFQDITTLLLDHKAFKDTVDIFVDRYRDMHISVVAGTNYSHALLFFFFS
jgi:adenine phosphoribosyltransferase